MAGKTDVYRVVYNDGKNEDGSQRNHNALVFQEPVEGKVYHANEMWLLPGATAAPVNDQGEIPQIETGEKGVSWSWQK